MMLEALAEYIKGGGNNVDDSQLVARSLATCLERSYKRMRGRVDGHTARHVRNVLDQGNLVEDAEAFVRYCEEGDNFDDLSNILFIKHVEFLCGYFSEAVGSEARYRVERFAKICAREGSSSSPRLIDMAAQNASQWLEKTMY